MKRPNWDFSIHCTQRMEDVQSYAARHEHGMGGVPYHVVLGCIVHVWPIPTPIPAPDTEPKPIQSTSLWRLSVRYSVFETEG